MFKNIFKGLKGAIHKVMENTGVKREYKNVFEIEGVPSFSQFYRVGIYVWKHIYKGFYNRWHIIKAPTIENQNATRECERLNMAKAITAELAGLIFNEQCKIKVSSFNLAENEDDLLHEFIDKVLKENNFNTKSQEFIEQVLALGGGCYKSWVEGGNLDENNNIIAGSEKIKIGYAMADQFIPTAWDNAGVTEGLFISRKAKDGYYYTKIEWHKWNGECYEISNQLYRCKVKNEVNETQDILGVRCPLAFAYPFLKDNVTLNDATRSQFSYVRTSIANNIDDDSPLGISIYGNALSTLKALDICYDSLIREFRLGKKRIYVPTSAIKTIIDPVTNNPCRYFDVNDETYEAFKTDSMEDLKVQESTSVLRVEEHVNAINAFLSILCLQVGFSAGTFTFDLTNGIKTATEVISENSKTYKTIKGHQNILKDAIMKLIENILELAKMYEIKYKDVEVSTLLKNGYEIKIDFDDSILQDRQTNIAEGLNLVNNRVMSRYKFMVDTLKYTDKEAKDELALIAHDDKVDNLTIDNFNLSGE